jgi:hypothetical protein
MAEPKNCIVCGLSSTFDELDPKEGTPYLCTECFRRKQAGRTLLGEVNGGFTIIQQGDTAVVGFNESKGEYVAWHYRFDNAGVPSFFWGRYGDREEAFKKYQMKERGEYSG